MSLSKLISTALLATLASAFTFAAEKNPAQAGFNAAESDAKAIAIADATMAAMGGRQAWDETRHLTWRFFGNRLHVWDKYTGDHRFENKDQVVLSNLNTGIGRVWEAGTEVTKPDAVAKAVNQAKGAWINDSYWLVMPYKLKDSGVTLKYVGVQPNAAGRPSDVLQLTFQAVGRTPDNKYHVFVDQSTHLVTEWTFWKDYNSDDSRSLGPWTNWQRYGKILLADGHGDKAHTDIAVFQKLPASVYTAPAPFVLSAHR
jgi:hypothetical protein